MNSIDRRFVLLRQQGRKALMPYLTLGYPALDSALDVVPALVAAGADVLELGIPFSDPLTDGPVIQASSQRAIANGMTLARALEQLQALQARCELPPVVLMTYTNLLLNHGLKAFAEQAAAAGAAGVIVPDLPLEESAEVRQALAACGLYLIQMVTPNLDDARIAGMARVADGFIYVVSVLGVTGARAEVPDVTAFAARVRRFTTLPLALGFGISTPEQARQARQHVDGIIVGSALIRSLNRADTASVDAYRFLKDFSQ